MNYHKATEAAQKLGETNDCAVKAVSIATGTPYEQVHALMKKHGRRDCRGTYMSTTNSVLKELGVESKWEDAPRQAPKTVKRGGVYGLTLITETRSRYTVSTIAKALPKRGRFILETSTHLLAFVNGRVEDWTEGRRHRVLRVIRVK